MDFQPEIEDFKEFLKNEAHTYHMRVRENMCCPVWSYIDCRTQRVYSVGVLFWTDRNYQDHPLPLKFSDFIQRCDSMIFGRFSGNEISAQQCLDILDVML